MSTTEFVKTFDANPGNEKGDDVCELPRQRKRSLEEDLMSCEVDARIYEYASAANPYMHPIPVAVHPASSYESGPTRVIPFDLSKAQRIGTPCTTPNLLASFVKICAGECLNTEANATSQAFFVIRGQGKSVTEHGEVPWNEGDLFVAPFCAQPIIHSATMDAALYWVHDEPLLIYLGVKPNTRKFELTLFRKERMLTEVERIRHLPDALHRNRLGILLGNRATEDSTKTLSHTLWSLLNVLPADDAQRPHRHNSVALDLCVMAEEGDKVYTMMGPELGEDGWVKNPVKCVWRSGAAFTTPPGWWHSHHNETGTNAWVLPMQDAGLYTYQRTLDIRFS